MSWKKLTVYLQHRITGVEKRKLSVTGNSARRNAGKINLVGGKKEDEGFEGMETVLSPPNKITCDPAEQQNVVKNQMFAFYLLRGTSYISSASLRFLLVLPSFLFLQIFPYHRFGVAFQMFVFFVTFSLFLHLCDCLEFPVRTVT